MTWPEAIDIADEQIAFWKCDGVTAGDALAAIEKQYPDAYRWHSIRQWLAGWTMGNHAEEN